MHPHWNLQSKESFTSYQDILIKRIKAVAWETDTTSSLSYNSRTLITSNHTPQPQKPEDNQPYHDESNFSWSSTSTTSNLSLLNGNPQTPNIYTGSRFPVCQLFAPCCSLSSSDIPQTRDCTFKNVTSEFQRSWGNSSVTSFAIPSKFPFTKILGHCLRAQTIYISFFDYQDK